MYADCRGPEAAPFMIEGEALNYLHHDFVGREKELQRLKRFYESDREKLAVLYGRRRVGKSELLRASLCDGDIPFVFLQCRATSLQSNPFESSLDSIRKLWNSIGAGLNSREFNPASERRQASRA